MVNFGRCFQAPPCLRPCLLNAPEPTYQNWHQNSFRGAYLQEVEFEKSHNCMGRLKVLKRASQIQGGQHPLPPPEIETLTNLLQCQLIPPREDKLHIRDKMNWSQRVLYSNSTVGEIQCYLLWLQLSSAGGVVSEVAILLNGAHRSCSNKFGSWMSRYLKSSSVEHPAQQPTQQVQNVYLNHCVCFKNSCTKYSGPYSEASIQE